MEPGIQGRLNNENLGVKNIVPHVTTRTYWYWYNGDDTDCNSIGLVIWHLQFVQLWIFPFCFLKQPDGGYMLWRKPVADFLEK
jgi:hypothetical protein